MKTEIKNHVKRLKTWVGDQWAISNMIQRIKKGEITNEQVKNISSFQVHQVVDELNARGIDAYSRRDQDLKASVVARVNNMPVDIVPQKNGLHYKENRDTKECKFLNIDVPFTEICGRKGIKTPADGKIRRTLMAMAGRKLATQKTIPGLGYKDWPDIDLKF